MTLLLPPECSRVDKPRFGKVWVGPTGMFAWLASIFGSMRMDDIKSCQTVLLGRRSNPRGA